MPYGRLEQFTELVVSPKSRTGVGNLSDSPVKTSQNQHPHSQSNLSDPTGSSVESTSSVPQSHQWGGIADLKSLLRYMIKGTYGPVKELPPVPNIPALFTDSIYRVCGAPPHSLCTISHVATGVIHLFSWSHELNGGQSPVTYGLLSKVPSPKEVREIAKQAMEKKKNAGVTKVAATVNERDEMKEEQTMVVKVVCHGIDKLAGKQRSPIKGQIHSGGVWVSMLSNREICIPIPSYFRLTMLFYF